MKTEEERIEEARSELLGLDLVHLDDPDAREGFLAGKVLFDVSDGGNRLGRFFSSNPDLEVERATTPSGFFQSKTVGSGNEAFAVSVAVHKGYGAEELEALRRELEGVN